MCIILGLLTTSWIFISNQPKAVVESVVFQQATIVILFFAIICIYVVRAAAKANWALKNHRVSFLYHMRLLKDKISHARKEYNELVTKCQSNPHRTDADDAEKSSLKEKIYDMEIAFDACDIVCQEMEARDEMEGYSVLGLTADSSLVLSMISSLFIYIYALLQKIFTL